MISSKTYFVLLTCASLGVVGCAKHNGSSSSGSPATNGTTPSLISSSLQLPVPGSSYGTSTAYPTPHTAPNPGGHVTRLLTLVDAIAAPLKESNISLLQTVKQGQYLQGSLHIAHNGLKSDLVGSRQDSQGLINWTYKLNGLVTFSGSTATAGTSGDLTFPVSTQNVQPVAVHWNFTNGGAQSIKNLTVSQGTVGSLSFTILFSKNSSATTVTLSGRNSGSFAGKWDSTGGYLQENTDAKQCWNAHLQDSTCP